MISPFIAFWTVNGADDLFKRITYSEFTNSIMECTNSDLLAVWFSTLGETDLTIANAGLLTTSSLITPTNLKGIR